jgi:DNA-binding beta-propeller fold protein YncE
MQLGAQSLTRLMLIAAVTTAGCGVQAASTARPDATSGRSATVYVLSAGEMTPIQVGSDRPQKQIRMPGLPVAMVVTPNGDRAYVASLAQNGASGLVTPVSLVTRVAGRPIRVPPYPMYLAITPDGRTVYVASQIDGDNQYPGQITPIDVATGKAGSPIRVGIDPGPILITPDGKTAYIANSGFSTQGSGSYLTPISIAAGRARKPISLPGTGVAMTPDGTTIYAVGTDYGAGPAPTAGPDRASSAWVGARPARTGVVVPISTATSRTGKPIRIPGNPSAIAVAPDGRTAYVLDDPGPGARPETAIPVSVITHLAGRPVPVAAQSFDIAFAPDGKTAYVLGSGIITQIRVAADTVQRLIRVAKPSVAIAFTPDSRIAYVVSSPYTIRGDRISFGRSSVVRVSAATGIAGASILVGREAMALAVVP